MIYNLWTVDHISTLIYPLVTILTIIDPLCFLIYWLSNQSRMWYVEPKATFINAFSDNIKKSELNNGVKRVIHWVWDQTRVADFRPWAHVQLFISDSDLIWLWWANVRHIISKRIQLFLKPGARWHGNSTSSYILLNIKLLCKWISSYSPSIVETSVYLALFWGSTTPTKRVILE